MSSSSLKALTIVTLVVTVILFLLDFYLLTFHMYLIHHNISTYKHIRKQQKRKKSRVIRQINQGSPETAKADSRDQVLPDESQNANSFSLSGNNFNDSNNIKKRKPRRITAKDILCCFEKSNPILRKKQQKTSISSPVINPTKKAASSKLNVILNQHEAPPLESDNSPDIIRQENYEVNSGG